MTMMRETEKKNRFESEPTKTSRGIAGCLTRTTKNWLAHSATRDLFQESRSRMELC